MPDELIDAMAFAATDRGGSVTMLMGDNEIARLVLAWRNMSRRDSHLVEDAQTAIRTSEGVSRLKAENARLRDALEAVAKHTTEFNPATDELRRIVLAALYPSNLTT